MNFFKKVTSASLAVTLLAFSFNASTTLANSSRVAGEILIADRGAEVTVNGEVAKSGRSIFSGSTIDTPANSGAILALGTAGRLELAPNSSFTVSFDGDRISGVLTAGKVSVITALEKVSVTTPQGSVAELGVGESTKSSNQQDDTAKSDKGSAAWVWIVVIGGVIAGVVLASMASNSSSAGGGTVPVSPSR
jgi:hypothetical protein